VHAPFPSNHTSRWPVPQALVHKKFGVLKRDSSIPVNLLLFPFHHHHHSCLSPSLCYSKLSLLGLLATRLPLKSISHQNSWSFGLVCLHKPSIQTVLSNSCRTSSHQTSTRLDFLLHQESILRTLIRVIKQKKLAFRHVCY